jgi:hypothetical protein
MDVVQRGRMATDPPAEPASGTSQTTPQRWGLRETLVAVGVVADGGTFATMVTQIGTVTAISPTAITVTSADGFTQTYRLPDAARTDRTIATSDEVSIQGKRTGGTTTARSVVIQIGPGGPHGPPGPAPQN